MNPAFWREKRVLVTGHTGFKGGWLSLWLQSMGARVVGVALDPATTPNLYDQAHVAAEMTSLRADIRDGGGLKEIFRQHEPEIVFHLAAQPIVLKAYSDPVLTYQTNVMGTLNVLESIRELGSVRCAVMVTSDKCYENREWVWGYREGEPMGGHDPYSSSKGCAELLIASYRRSYANGAAAPARLPTHLASVRAGNVIGGGDRAANRLVPDIIRAFEERRPVEVRYPTALRPWQHVLDPLSGYLEVAQRLYLEGVAFAEAWNFAPDDRDARSVRWIVERMCELWGAGAEWRIDDSVHQHENHYLKLDASKARSRLGWSPRWTLELALERTMSWHKAERTGAKMREVCFRQIDDYVGCKPRS